MDCLFCSIIQGDIPADKVYEDDAMLVFRDIAPQAPVHLLVIPKTHISSLDGIGKDNAGAVGRIFAKIPEIARANGLEKGYRLISNCGPDAKQSVPHLHFHLLGGRELGEGLV